MHRIPNLLSCPHDRSVYRFSSFATPFLKLALSVILPLKSSANEIQEQDIIILQGNITDDINRDDNAASDDYVFNWLVFGITFGIGFMFVLVLSFIFRKKIKYVSLTTSLHYSVESFEISLNNA